MEFEVTFRDDHVHVQLGGGATPDPDLPKDYWEALEHICKQHDCKRILVEGTAPKFEMDAASVVEAGQRTAAVPNTWLAFHLDNHEPNEQSELYETIATTKGVRVKFFSDRDEALRWLRSNAPK